MSDHIVPELGKRYGIMRGGDLIVGECVQTTPYQVGLRVEDEPHLRWVATEELREVIEDEEQLPTLAECRDMLAIVMATLEHHERKAAASAPCDHRGEDAPGGRVRCIDCGETLSSGASDER